MEVEVKKMVFQAKRLFMVDVSKTEFAEYDITKDEVIFWFHTLYSDKFDMYRQTINSMFL